MNKAIGMVEYRTVSAGIKAADLMIKTSSIDIIQATTVCPGKYVIIIGGGLSSVNASVEAAKTQLPEQLVDSFVLGNPAECVFTALYGGSPVEDAKALGVLETFSAPSIIVAADAAAKAADVTVIEIRVARGMGGKSFMLLTGDVAAVSAAIEIAERTVGDEGMLLDSAVIPNPDKDLWGSIL